MRTLTLFAVLWTTPALAVTETVIQVLPGAETIAIVDLDRDGWNDLAYTAWHAAELRGDLWVAWNNHDGTFSPTLIDDQLPWARDVKVLHRPDRHWPLLVVSAYRSGHYLFDQPWPRLFTKWTIADHGYGSITHAVGVLDQYSRLEDVVTAQDGEGGSLTLWQNMDSNVFAARATVPVNEPSYVTLADVDHNGLNDVVVAHKTGLSYYRFSEGPWALSAPMSILDTLHKMVFVAVADVNRDGMEDFIGGGTQDGLFWVDGTEPGVRHDIDCALTSLMFAEARDLNGDGRVDIAAVSLGDPLLNLPAEVKVYWQQPDGSWQTELLESGRGGRGLAIGDLRHNGQKQIAVSDFLGQRIVVWDLMP